MTTTRVVRVLQHGSADTLVIGRQDLVDPKPGQVRVAVHAAGVNFMDTQLRSGFYPQALPFALGHEGAGVVESCGKDVQGFEPGDRVAWAQAMGSHADRANIPCDRLIKIPESASFEAAAAVLFQGMTAHYLACSTYPLNEGSTCLVHSAAGGVGLLLCQIAKLRAARVVATISSERKRSAVNEAGADAVLLYPNGFADDVKAQTDGRGVDVIFDAVGQATFEDNLRCLKPRGLLALYGEASGPVPPLDLNRLSACGSIYVTRTGLGAYAASQEERLWRMGEIMDWLGTGKLRPQIHAILPLDKVSEAHLALESRDTIGKIILKP
jgi:NADPH2:quinone reductase